MQGGMSVTRHRWELASVDGRARATLPVAACARIIQQTLMSSFIAARVEHAHIAHGSQIEIQR